jgi:uncharacterized protein (DUF362 family)/Pyruvate/2-oxoacid:ferredoxin oxidoreductase delta subunit
MNAVVYLSKCEEYECLLLKEKMKEGLSAIGFDPARFAGRRVALKPNLLSASPVEKAVVTHPEFFRAALQLVKEHGGLPVLVESPAFQPLRKVIRKTGYDRILLEEDCEAADTKETAVLFYEGGSGYRRFEVAGALFEADIVLSLPKFKTHGITYVTGAVKNLFGFIPGLNKGQWHVRAHTKEAFAAFLMDYYEALHRGFERPKQYLHVMDAIMGMEGEGPGTAGRPRKIGALVVGDDGVAVDAVAVHIVGLDKSKVRTLVLGERRGLGVASLQKIDLRGSRPEEFDVADFVPPRSETRFNMGRWPMNTNLFKNLFVERPVPSEMRCTLCYQCRTICPAGAISRTDNNEGVPSYDYTKCIRCYCCMEICPEAAIHLRRGRLQWVLDMRG